MNDRLETNEDSFFIEDAYAGQAEGAEFVLEEEPPLGLPLCFSDGRGRRRLVRGRLAVQKRGHV